MTAIVQPGQTPRFVAVRRRRRSFGLDAPRPRDHHRLETEVRAWIDAHVPAAMTLRLEPDKAGCPPALIVLLPGCRILVLSIEPHSTETAPGVRWAEACRSRGVTLAPIGHVDDARAAFRRLGIEPGER